MRPAATWVGSATIEAKRRSGLIEAEPIIAFSASPVLVSYGVR